jgi:ABC-type nitrate/sulfonate/bicarbonate transport system permease component
LRFVLVPASTRRILIGLRMRWRSAGSLYCCRVHRVAARTRIYDHAAALGLETPTVIAGMVVIGAVGGALSAALELLTRRLVPWEQRV